jgi:DNA processing protein
MTILSNEMPRALEIGDADYPQAFRELKDPPPVIYVRGKWPLQLERTIGIVGTRQCTLYGQEMAERIGREAAACGYVVVSGLARGIDTAAHVGAMKTGTTIAVIGSGLNHIYPKENEGLAKQITVISEFPMDAGPQKHHFPKRNRLVSALSKGLLLAEAPIKSGAMITMEMAEKAGRVCFCLPGRADIESFRGNHFLIKKGKAILVENWGEMLSILEPGQVAYRQKETQRDFFGLDEEEQKLLSFLSSEEISIEHLAAKTSLPVSKLSSLLMGLVLKQVIRELPGKYYMRIHG